MRRLGADPSQFALKTAPSLPRGERREAELLQPLSSSPRSFELGVVALTVSINLPFAVCDDAPLARLIGGLFDQYLYAASI